MCVAVKGRKRELKRVYCKAAYKPKLGDFYEGAVIVAVNGEKV